MRLIEVSDTPFHELHYRSSGKGGQVRHVVLPFFRAWVDVLPDGVSAFVATSDLQGRENDQTRNRLVGEVVADELVLLQELTEIPPVDFIALAGDLYDYPTLHKLGGTGDVTSVWNGFADPFHRVIGVHGNHDQVDHETLRHNIQILDGGSVEVNGLRIGGVSGIIGRSDRNQRKSDEDYLQALTKVTRSKNGLILLHQGPDDPVNQQIGNRMIREHLESNGKALVIFGHCHWTEPFQTMGQNQLLNVDNRLYVISARKSDHP